MKKRIVRKAIKIKASILIVAWLAIFFHGIVPHNHSEAFPEEGFGYFHTSCTDEIQDGTFLRFEKNPSEKSICPWSGFVYHHINPDNLLIHSFQSDLSSLTELNNPKFYHSSLAFVSDPHPGNTSLRAPPHF